MLHFLKFNFSFCLLSSGRCAKGHLSCTEVYKANQLTLSVKPTVQSSIESYLSEEGVEGVDCKECEAKVDKLKSYSVLSQPQNLIIHLQRFNALNMKNKSHVQLQHQIQFGTGLYKLVSTVFHHGDRTNEGHYTATCASMVSGKFIWHNFDDSSVSEFIAVSVISLPAWF